MDEAEVTQTTNGGYLYVDGHAGSQPWESGSAWHVDTVADTSGNQMRYQYNQRDITKQYDYIDSQTQEVGTFTVTTSKNRIAKIDYNYPLTYSNWLPDDTSGLTPGSRIAFYNDQEDTKPARKVNWITNILVFHGDVNGDPIAEYRITSQKTTVQSPACTDYTVTPPKVEKVKTRKITQIQRWQETDSSPFTNDSGYTLPATTFNYTNLPHYHDELDDSKTCFVFPYLSRYKNNYGGIVTVTYSADGADGIHGRSVGTYEGNGSSRPQIGYSYYVSEYEVDDGWGNIARITYEPSDPCYTQEIGNNWGPNPTIDYPLQCSHSDAPDYAALTGLAVCSVMSMGMMGMKLSSLQPPFTRH